MKNVLGVLVLLERGATIRRLLVAECTVLTTTNNGSDEEKALLAGALATSARRSERRWQA